MKTNCPVCGSAQCSCEKELGTPKIKTITAEALKEKMEHDNNLIVINTLQASDYDICHITKSISIPMSILPEEVIDWDRYQEIVVYCASSTCPISKQAYLLLTSLGFHNVTAYEGGILEWAQKGFPTEGPCKIK